MNLITIALLQLTAEGNDQSANMEKGIEYCRKAQQMGADIALFPEMWNIGYTAYDESVWRSDFDPLHLSKALQKKQQRWQNQAIDAQSDFMQVYRELARGLQMAIGITYLRKGKGSPFNSFSLIDSNGYIVSTYDKVHTCDFSLEAACQPGKGFSTAALQIGDQEVQVGSMICYDREFPESTRILMLQGAELILIPNSCTMESHRLQQLQTRAFENMVGVASVNYAAPQCNGHSAAYHPMAFDASGQSQDNTVVLAGDQPGIYLAQFDLEAIRTYRKRETWGNAYRKPRSYKIILDKNVNQPFIRPDAR